MHNKLRGRIANGSEPAWGLGRPRAANMNKLVWSEELARIAQVKGQKMIKSLKTASSGKLVFFLMLFCFVEVGQSMHART